MIKIYCLFNAGRLSQQDNSLKFMPVDELYYFGEPESNSSLYNFPGKQQIPLHFFDSYENLSGSFIYFD